MHMLTGRAGSCRRRREENYAFESLKIVEDSLLQGVLYRGSSVGHGEDRQYVQGTVDLQKSTKGLCGNQISDYSVQANSLLCVCSSRANFCLFTFFLKELLLQLFYGIFNMYIGNKRYRQEKNLKIYIRCYYPTRVLGSMNFHESTTWTSLLNIFPISLVPNVPATYDNYVHGHFPW